MIGRFLRSLYVGRSTEYLLFFDILDSEVSMTSNHQKSDYSWNCFGEVGICGGLSGQHGFGRHVLSASG